MTEEDIALLKVRSKMYKKHINNHLYIQVKENGLKIYRFRYFGKTKTLGNYKKLSLEEAIFKAEILYSNAVAEKNREKTFEDVLEEGVKFYNWSYETKRKNVERIHLHMSALLRCKSIKLITRADIIDILSPLEIEGKHTTSHKLLGHLRKVFTFALIRDYISHDPTLNVKELLKKEQTKKMSSLTEIDDIKRLLCAIHEYKQFRVKSLMKFTILTLSLSSDARFAKWNEIEKGIWYPSRKPKGSFRQAIPLSLQCLEIIKKMREIDDSSEYLFLSFRTNRPFSNNALLTALKSMGFAKEDTTVQGFRTMGRMILLEMGYSEELINEALRSMNSEFSYRYKKVDQQELRMMLQAYADYLDVLLNVK